MEEYKPTIIDRLIWFWKDHIRYTHITIYQGIKNIIYWTPTIWKDRDWDQHYIYEVLKVKLEKQSAYFRKSDIAVNDGRNADRMQLAARLIERCQDDTYSIEYLDYVDSNALIFKLSRTSQPDRLDEYFKKYNRQYHLIISGQSNLYDRPVKKLTRQNSAMAIAYNNQNRCHKLLFKLLEQNIEHWWN